MKKIFNFVKKNFYFALVVIVLLFVAGFVIAAWDSSKASHGTLYTDRIEPKTTGGSVEVIGGLTVDGQSVVTGVIPTPPSKTKVGRYDGDGTTNHFIEVGFKPYYLYFRCHCNSNSDVACFKKADDSYVCKYPGAGDSNSFGSLIQADTTGFILKTADNHLNGNGKVYNYFASDE